MDNNTHQKFSDVRKLFPHTDKIVYFNSGSYGPFCLPVRQAIDDNVAIRLAAESDDSHDAFATRDELRGIYASMIGADECEIGIGASTSFGLNIAAFGLPLEPGDEVIVSDVEFPAIVYCWRAAAEARQLKLVFVESTDRQFDLDKFRNAITDRTKVLALSWVQYFDGYKNDLAEIGAICREHGIYFVVDGIQGMGTEPIDVHDLKLDLFTSGCQKWMLAPQGCAFFYLSKELQKILTPPFMSWLGVDWKMNFTDLFQYDLPYFESAAKYELGYYAVLNLLGMKAASQLFLDLGIDNIGAHNHALIDRLAAYIKGSSFYRITSSMEEKHRSSLFTFSCDNLKQLHRHILKQGIILVQREGSIRVSVHLFNNESDIDRLIDALDTFSQS